MKKIRAGREIQLKTAKDSYRREPIPYICGLGARFGCERISEYSTRRDENHRYGYMAIRFSVFGGSSVCSPIPANYLGR